MEKNINVIPAVLHLREASDLLKYEIPEVSTILLQLVQLLLIQFKVDNNDILSAKNIVSDISSNNC